MLVLRAGGENFGLLMMPIIAALLLLIGACGDAGDDAFAGGHTIRV